MTLRLTETENLKTRELLERILRPAKDGVRVAFLCPPGRGPATMQCLRVDLSRLRQAREKAGKKNAKFTLRSSVHRETHEGKRMDCVVVWIERNHSHVIVESLEDLLERA